MMVIHTFPRGETDPPKLMDQCIEEIEGFRSGAYRPDLGEFLADDAHGRISWNDETIWVEVTEGIKKGEIQRIIDDLSD